MNTEDIKGEELKCRKCCGNKFIKGQQIETTVNLYTRLGKEIETIRVPVFEIPYLCNNCGSKVYTEQHFKDGMVIKKE